MKFWLGVFVGVCILFILFWGYRVIINPHYALLTPKFITDNTQKRFVPEELHAWKTTVLNMEEKISSTNKRIDDFFIFGGIIITLLLAINVGVYVNADNVVDKHLKDHFGVHQKKVEGHLAEVEQIAGKVKTELELVQTFRKQIESIQPPLE